MKTKSRAETLLFYYIELYGSVISGIVVGDICPDTASTPFFLSLDSCHTSMFGFTQAGIICVTIRIIEISSAQPTFETIAVVIIDCVAANPQIETGLSHGRGGKNKQNGQTKCAHVHDGPPS
ncbi:hypothetical protein [Cohaesibacter gelatinilyticus]|uniref:hypothetical protein n=1 Tax=Cohaesibacter gelatinilyticus TaxID=372072 RepID=UPI001FCEFE07|nr:hypothetical protein [Cohaesibacter gelatinilyticus]